MEYNTEREKLIIREYGRNIQKLIQKALEIEDREKRTEFAKTIISVMGSMNPNTNETGDHRRKLWDHLFIMSDFKLDVDSPYPAPSKETLFRKPQKLDYKNNRIRYRMYGVNIIEMIKKATEYEEGEEKNALILTIANHMKKSYLTWNRDTVSDELIAEHLNVLSDGKLSLTEDMKLNSTREILLQNRKKKTTTTTNSKQSKSKKSKKKKSKK